MAACCVVTTDAMACSDHGLAMTALVYEGIMASR
jgi:hypothetical protein